MKRLIPFNFRVNEEENARILAYCAERNIDKSKLARRAVMNLIDAPADPGPGVRVKRRQLEVSNVEEVGRDALRANTGALKR